MISCQNLLSFSHNLEIVNENNNCIDSLIKYDGSNQFIDSRQNLLISENYLVQKG